MPSTKKLTSYRQSQFFGPRRKKPRVRDLNRAINERIDDEKSLLQRLVRDADVRRSLLPPAARSEPFLVWNDFDQPSSTLTEVNIHQLPKWKDVGQFLKLHLFFQVALEDGGYSFTARIRPDLEARWNADGRNHMDRITRLTRETLAQQGLSRLEYAFVVEGRSRRGGSRVPLHLHGFLLARDPLVATRFKVAMERAIAVHPLGRRAAGIKPRSGPEVVVKRAYDKNDGKPDSRGRWATYIAKNATRWDARFMRRVFMSQTATQTAREFWAMVREEPLS